MIRKIKKEVGCSFKENIQYMDQTLPVEKSFDIIRREMEIGGKESVFYYIDGFIKDEAMLKIMDSFLSITAEDLPQNAESFSKQKIPYVEVDVLKCFDDILRNVLSGTAVFFVDGYDAALCMDCRSYPARGVDEPDKDKSLRGSRDGFVETIVFNTALMRRRIRDPHLIMEMTEAIHTPFMSDRALAIENAQYIFRTMKDFGSELEFKEGGIIQSRANEVLQKATDLLVEIEHQGLFATLEQGIFADIKRPKDGGKGLDGVVVKDDNYFNPFITLMKKEV